jgi:hypothetical protein
MEIMITVVMVMGSDDCSMKFLRTRLLAARWYRDGKSGSSSNSVGGRKVNGGNLGLVMVGKLLVKVVKTTIATVVVAVQKVIVVIWEC